MPRTKWKMSTWFHNVLNNHACFVNSFVYLGLGGCEARPFPATFAVAVKKARADKNIGRLFHKAVLDETCKNKWNFWNVANFYLRFYSKRLLLSISRATETEVLCQLLNEKGRTRVEQKSDTRNIQMRSMQNQNEQWDEIWSVHNLYCAELK